MTEVNGQRTPDLDAFLDVVRRLPDCASVRLMTTDLTGKLCAVTLKTDHHYWPTTELRCEGGRWRLAAVEHCVEEGASAGR